jgi:hypothetical protein
MVVTAHVHMFGYTCNVRSHTKCLRRHPISECSASTPDRRRRPRSAPRSCCSGPPPAWARSSAGPLLLELRVVRAAPIHRSTVAHSESQEPECATTWPAVRRRVALRSSISGVACRADGWMLAVGWTCEIRVCIRVMRHGRLGTIDGADRLAILTLDACHVQTRVTAVMNPREPMASSPKA